MKKLTNKLRQIILVSTAIISFSSCSATVEPQISHATQEISINAQSYIPEFDGQDAFALAQETLLVGHSDIYYLHNNKLYLFKDEASKEKWFEQMDLMIEKADAYWGLTHAPKEEKFEDISDSFMKKSTY